MKKKVLSALLAAVMFIGVLSQSEIPTNAQTDEKGFTITFIDPTGENETVQLKTDENGWLISLPIMTISDKTSSDKWYASYWSTNEEEAVKTYTYEMRDKITLFSYFIEHSTTYRDKAPFKEDTTLYAVWDVPWNLPFSVIAATLDPNGGTLSSTQPTTWEWANHERIYETVAWKSPFRVRQNRDIRLRGGFPKKRAV